MVNLSPAHLNLLVNSNHIRKEGSQYPIFLLFFCVLLMIYTNCVLLMFSTNCLFSLFCKQTREITNQPWPWWPSVLRHYVISLNWYMACLRSKVLIPARDYNIHRSEVEILCRYSNSRAPVVMCHFWYRNEQDTIGSNAGGGWIKKTLFVKRRGFWKTFLGFLFRMYFLSP